MTRITDPRDPRERRRHRAPEADHLAAAVRLDLSLQDMRARDVAAGSPERPDDEPPTGLIDLNAIRALLGQPTTGDVDPAAAAWLAGGADPDAVRVVDRVTRLDGTVPPVEVTFGELYDEPDVAAALELTADELAAVDELEPERTLADSIVATAHIVPPSPDELDEVQRSTSLRRHFELQLAALPQPTGLEYTCEVLGNAFHTAPCGELQHPPVTLEVPPFDTLEAWERYVTGPKVDPLLAQAAPELARKLAAPVFSSEHPRLTWRSRHDPRSLAFGVRRQLEAAPLADRMWFPGPVLDQGAEGACVGFGIVDALNAAAAGDTDGTATDARELYELADRTDGDGLTGQGTSVLAGLKAAQQLGKLTGYSWCFGTRDIAQAVLQRGPVIVGVPWLSGMYDTAAGGLVELTGEDTGAGHCLAVVGILLRGPQGQPGPYFVWQNSWGSSYGDRGLGYVHHRDLATLLHGVGEAAVPHV